MGACGGHAYNYAAELNNSSGQEPDSSTGSHGHVCIEYEGGGHRLKFDVKVRPPWVYNLVRNPLLCLCIYLCVHVVQILRHNESQ